ncbi:MAG: hypothetical protein SVX38_03560 [Chloroflexota bacterium]|nr:hypothetical protein [Chloroflexota bacterium]
MRKQTLANVLSFTVVSAALIVGCQSTPTQAPPTKAPAPATGLSLQITGDVDDEELALATNDLAAYEQVKVTTELKGESVTFQGVLINDLLAAGGANGETLTLVAEDGYSGEVKLADIADCAECIVVIEEDSLRAVLPGQPTKVWVKNLVEMRVD